MSETKITKMVVQKEGRKLIFNPAGDIDLSQYYTKSEIDSKFNSYALKTEIPDTSNLATKTELNSVKSTATTANSTANSAKTTAQNALNIANSKSSFNINKQTFVDSNNRVKSATFSTNTFGYFSSYWDGEGTTYQNGIDIYGAVYMGEGTLVPFAANSAISCSKNAKWSLISL